MDGTAGSRGRKLAALALAALLAAWLLQSGHARAQDTIKVGLVYSLSGIFAISETLLKDMSMMAIDEINAKGGLLGKKIQPVLVDPASNPRRYAELAEQLIVQEKVSAIFCCTLSGAVRAVLPVAKKHNAILIAPVGFEGHQVDDTVFFTGATPGQKAGATVDYLMGKQAGGGKKFALLATDFQYPRSTNRILRALLRSQKVNDGDILELYAKFGDTDFANIVSRIKEFGGSDRTTVILTLEGDSTPFFKALEQAGMKQKTTVIATNTDEQDLRVDGAGRLAGSLAVQSYFSAARQPANDAFLGSWRSYVAKNNLPKGYADAVNGSMLAAYQGVNLWARAVSSARSTESAKVSAAMADQTVNSFVGVQAKLDKGSHRISTPMLVGEIGAGGKLSVVWNSNKLLGPALSLDVCNIKEHCEKDANCPKPCPNERRF